MRCIEITLTNGKYILPEVDAELLAQIEPLVMSKPYSDVPTHFLWQPDDMTDDIAVHSISLLDAKVRDLLDWAQPSFAPREIEYILRSCPMSIKLNLIRSSSLGRQVSLLEMRNTVMGVYKGGQS